MMNFTAIFCCYVLLPYFASIVSPPQETITCYAGRLRRNKIRNMQSIQDAVGQSIRDIIGATPKPKVASSEEQSTDENLTENIVHLTDKYFEQKCDHYHINDATKWQQRYLIYDNHYDGKGIIFIRIGTDKDIEERHMQIGSWSEYCRKAKALCIGIERRGYGDNLPYGNLNNENLKYMSSEQVLADVAWFIYNFRSLKTDYVLPEKLKWVAYGNADQGTLAAWLRMKYPHLVDAVLSLSAPLLAKEDDNDFFNLIEQDMSKNDQTLKDKINEAFTEIRKHATKKKINHLAALFNFCDDNPSGADSTALTKNTEFMYFMFAHTIASIIQYGNDGMSFMKRKTTNIMENKNGKYEKYDTAIKKFALVINKMLEKYGKNCLQMDYIVAINGYKLATNNKEYLLDFLLPETLGNRACFYQNCNEFGRFETIENFFGINIDSTFFTDFCIAVYGGLSSRELLEKGVRRTNIFYGGLNIVVSNVVFVYGSDDPYRNYGIIGRRHPPNSVVYTLEGARTCTELDKYEFTKPEHDKRDEIYSQLTKWINLSNNYDAGEDHEFNGNTGQ